MLVDLKQEMVHYLNHVRSTWNTILMDDQTLLECTDELTIEAIQLRAPLSSKTDHDFLCTSMDSGKLFPLIRNSTTRLAIRKNLLSVNHLIPSLFTFLEDLKYLKPRSKIMKSLLPDPLKMTIREGFHQHFFGGDSSTNEHTVFQNQESSFVAVIGSWQDCFVLGLLQLWAFSTRYFPQMIQFTPKMDEGSVKPLVQEPNAHIWYKFADLAHRLGFRSQEIDKILAENTDVKITPGSLHTLRPEVMYGSNAVPFASLAQEVNKSLQNVCCSRERETRPHITVADAEELSHRCGMPYNESQERDREYLFLDTLYDSPDRYNSSGDEISSFYVKRAIFFAFFGTQLPKYQILKESPPPHVPFTTADHGSALREETDVNLASEIRDKIVHSESEVSPDPEGQQMVSMTAFSFLNLETDNNIRIKKQYHLQITHTIQPQRKKSQ